MNVFKAMLFSVAAALATFGVAAPLNAGVLISEVFYDAAGADGELEWVELFNSGPAPVDLSTYSLGFGGTDYTYGTFPLVGTIEPGEYFVVGGPIKRRNLIRRFKTADRLRTEWLFLTCRMCRLQVPRFRLMS